ncbi:hypothetical protein [[Eubacterium] cellulosolvens]
MSMHDTTSSGRTTTKPRIIAGIIVIVIGLIFIAVGFAEREEAAKINTKTTEETLFGGETEVTDMDKLAEKNSKEFNGIALIMFGIFICIAGLIGIFSGFQLRSQIPYQSPIYTRVDETSKNTHTKPHPESSETPEKIRIRCARCKYLETTDATFCSKCGARLY